MMNKHHFQRHWCEACGEAPGNMGGLRTVPVSYARTMLTLCHACWDDVLRCAHSNLPVGSVLEQLLAAAYRTPQRYAKAAPMSRAHSVRMH